MSCSSPPSWSRRTGAGPLPVPAGSDEAALPAQDEPEDQPLARLHRLMNDASASADQRQAAAKEVLARYGPAMRASLARRWRCDAHAVDDCFQQTMLLFLTRTPADCAVPEAWFHRIFINQLIDQYRRGRRQCSLDALMEGPGFTEPISMDLLRDPFHVLLRKEVEAYLLSAVALASPSRAQVLKLLCEGAEPADVARVLRISPGAARDRVFRVRQCVRLIFSNDV